MAEHTIATKVAEQIKNIAPAVEKQVVDLLVQRELDRRSNALVQVVDKLAELEGELKKSRPDMLVFDDKGEEVASGFSKSRKEEREKLGQKIEKYTKAIEKALKGDMSDVFNLAQSKGQD